MIICVILYDAMEATTTNEGKKNASSYQNESVWITFIKWQTQFEIIAFLVLEQVFLSWFTLIKGIRQQLQLRLHNKIQHSNQTQMLNFEVVVCAAHVPAGRRAARVDARRFFFSRNPFPVPLKRRFVTMGAYAHEHLKLAGLCWRQRAHNSTQLQEHLSHFPLCSSFLDFYHSHSKW